MPLEDDADIAELLATSRRIAVVGASNKPERASYGVMRALIDRGYDVIPVNPMLVGQSIHGRAVVGALSDIDGAIDIVDIFRKSDDAGAAVDDAIFELVSAVWLQLGVIDHAAAARAEAAGLSVVMDRCIKVEAARLGVSALR